MSEVKVVAHDTPVVVRPTEETVTVRPTESPVIVRPTPTGVAVKVTATRPAVIVRTEAVQPLVEPLTADKVDRGDKTLAYDVVGRLEAITFTATNELRQLVYDVDGRLAQVLDPAGSTLLGYDAEGRLAAVNHI